MAPENAFPAGLDDCIATYQWLRANGPGGAAAPVHDGLGAAGTGAGRGGGASVVDVKGEDRYDVMFLAGTMVSRFGSQERIIPKAGPSAWIEGILPNDIVRTTDRSNMVFLRGAQEQKKVLQNKWHARARWIASAQ